MVVAYANIISRARGGSYGVGRPPRHARPNFPALAQIWRAPRDPAALSTVGAFAAVAEAHRTACQPFDREHPAIARSWQGMSRIKAKAGSVERKAAPLMGDQLRELVTGLDLARTLDARDAALLTLGWAAALRGRSLSASTGASRVPAAASSRSSTRASASARNVEDVAGGRDRDRCAVLRYADGSYRIQQHMRHRSMDTTGGYPRRPTVVEVGSQGVRVLKTLRANDGINSRIHIGAGLRFPF